MSKDILMTDQLIEKKRALYREIDTIYYQRRDLKALLAEGEEVIRQVQTDIARMLPVRTYSRIREDAYSHCLLESDAFLEGLAHLDKALKAKEESLSEEAARLREEDKGVRP